MIGTALQAAIYAALTAAPALAEGRVYDQVPAKAKFPHITIGDEHVLDDGNACGEGWEVFSDIHVWSRPKNGSKGEVKDIAATVVERLVDRALPIRADMEIVVAQLQNLRVLRDPDGKTEHAIVTVRHLINPA